MKNKVLSFIKRRWSKDSDWINGNCYWFALILKERFPLAEIYYLPVEGHFITQIDRNFYDWTGIVQPNEMPIKFSDIKKNDSLWYERIIRDCFK